MTIKYVVSRQMLLPDDVVLQPGEIAPDEVETWPNLMALVSAGFLYAFSDDEEAPYVPPHLYRAGWTLADARQRVTLGATPDPQVDWNKPDVLQKVEDLDELEREDRANQKRIAEERAQRHVHFQEAQILSPRPIELPPEKFLVDSSRTKATPKDDETDPADLATGVEHITDRPDEPEDNVLDVPEPLDPEDLPEPADQEKEDLAAAEANQDEEDDVEEPPLDVSADPRLEDAAEGSEGDSLAEVNDAFTKAELVDLAQQWNDDHPDDRINTAVNKPELIADLRAKGVV